MKNNKKYTHLSLEEREKLFAFKKQGLSLRKIARKLKRSHSSLIRELKRNARYGQGYIPCKAHYRSLKRQRRQRQQASWKGPEVYLYIREGLNKHWSPEQIAGRYCLEHPKKTLSAETIYKTIYARDNKKEKLWTKLRFTRKKRMSKNGRRVHREGRIPEAVSIDKRPKIVDKRKRVGDWESDNLIGMITDKTALSVTVERRLRLTLLAKVLKTADGKTRGLFARLSVFPDNILKTLTEDNGKENTNHKQITSSLGMDVFFCHSYSSWEKGTNENTNGRIRRFIPKRMSIDCLDEKTIQKIEWILNNTPRKCLGFKTPYEKLQEYLTRHV